MPALIMTGLMSTKQKLDEIKTPSYCVKASLSQFFKAVICGNLGITMETDSFSKIEPNDFNRKEVQLPPGRPIQVSPFNEPVRAFGQHCQVNQWTDHIKCAHPSNASGTCCMVSSLLACRRDDHSRCSPLCNIVSC